MDRTPKQREKACFFLSSVELLSAPVNVHRTPKTLLLIGNNYLQTPTEKTVKNVEGKTALSQLACLCSIDSGKGISWRAYFARGIFSQPTSARPRSPLPGTSVSINSNIARREPEKEWRDEVGERTLRK